MFHPSVSDGHGDGPTDRKPRRNIYKEYEDLKTELDAICKELKLKDVKYLPSHNGNLGELARHAIVMLKAYKAHIEGDKSASVQEIYND